MAQKTKRARLETLNMTELCEAIRAEAKAVQPPNCTLFEFPAVVIPNAHLSVFNEPTRFDDGPLRVEFRLDDETTKKLLKIQTDITEEHGFNVIAPLVRCKGNFDSIRVKLVGPRFWTPDNEPRVKPVSWRHCMFRPKIEIQGIWVRGEGEDATSGWLVSVSHLQVKELECPFLNAAQDSSSTERG